MPLPVTMDQPELALVRVVNNERKAHGLRALRPAVGLTRAARSHSYDEMRHFTLGHAGSDGASFGQRLAHLGHFRMSGEVVAFTSLRRRATARRIVRLWMASPPHRAQLLAPGFRIMGVGRSRNSRGTWVTADLATR